jgi:aspartyl protease family protein
MAKINRTRIVLSLLALALSSIAGATDVNVVGLFSGKAMLEIDKAPARMISVGQKINGVKLLEANSESAVVEVNGKREKLQMGQSIASAGPTSERPKIVLTADSKGHFITTGQMNGATTTFLVDTGATTIAMSKAEAKRLGISFVNARRGISSTANGEVAYYQIKLDTVKIGDVTLHQVEAAVIDGGGMDITLLGMSFLNRLDMKRSGSTLTLTKSF